MFINRRGCLLRTIAIAIAIAHEVFIQHAELRVGNSIIHKNDPRFLFPNSLASLNIHRKAFCVMKDSLRYELGSSVRLLLVTGPFCLAVLAMCMQYIYLTHVKVYRAKLKEKTAVAKMYCPRPSCNTFMNLDIVGRTGPCFSCPGKYCPPLQWPAEQASSLASGGRGNFGGNLNVL